MALICQGFFCYLLLGSIILASIYSLLLINESPMKILASNITLSEAKNSFRETTCKDGTKEALLFLRSAPKCQELLEEGSLVTPTHWVTPACTSKNYTNGDLKSCLLSRSSPLKIGMTGDSRMRQIAVTFGEYMENPIQGGLPDGGTHGVTYQQPLLNIKLEYFWRPFADHTVHSLFSRWLKASGDDAVDMVIIGIGTWDHMMEIHEMHPQVLEHYPNAPTNKLNSTPQKSLSLYEEDLRSLSVLMNELGQRIPVVWVAQAQIDSLKIFKYEKMPNTVSTFRDIAEYNLVAENVLKKTNVTFWKSAYTISNLTYNTSPDCNHYGPETRKALVNILWNFYCNS